VGIFKAVSHQQTIVSDRKVLKLHDVPQSHTTKMPKVLLQRAEEIFPALKEDMISVVCMK
jgi:hypothetical protein